MVTALERSSKESFQLVSFRHAGGAVYFTDWTSDYDFEGNEYLATPDLEVRLPKNDGLLGENVCTVTLPLSSDPDDFTARISSASAFAPTVCTVVEITRPTTPGPSQVVDTVFIGDVQLVRRNLRNNRNRIRLSCTTIKSRLDTVSLGEPCNHTCTNDLFDARCKVDRTIHAVNVVVASIDGARVTINTNPTVAGKADRYFHRGYLEYQGLRIGIRDWRSTSPTEFNLVRRAPSWWVGQTVVAVAGCDKSIQTCRDRFAPIGGVPAGTTGNESNFNGRGYAIPAHNPQFENSP